MHLSDKEKAVGSSPTTSTISLHKDGGPKVVGNTNAEKSAQLGMPHGTAANRLRKIIMFSLLVRLHENLCFRCGREIEKADDLSVEHKEPWLHVSSDLYWDLENIAFSHGKCNVGSARTDTPRQVERLASLHARNRARWGR